MGSRRKTAWALGALLAAGAAGCGGAGDHTPTSAHTGLVGREGGGHALGSDPKAEMKRISRGGSTPSGPGSLPGR